MNLKVQFVTSHELVISMNFINRPHDPVNSNLCIIILYGLTMRVNSKEVRFLGCQSLKVTYHIWESGQGEGVRLFEEPYNAPCGGWAI